MKPARLNWIDYARGIAIILVAYRHVYEGAKSSGVNVEEYIGLEYANIFFYSFRMPLFFIVSGIFISLSIQKRGIQNYIGTRAKTILYPYFLWGALQLIMQMVFAKYANGQPDPAALLHLFYLPRELAQFWYLYALFNVSMVYLFTKFIVKIPPVINLLIGAIMFYISAIIYQQNIPTGFIFDVLHYYLFFAIGDVAGKFLLSESFRKVASSGKYLLLMLPFFLAAQTYFLLTNLNHAVAKYMYVEFYQPFVFVFISLVGCSFMIFLTHWLEKKAILKWLIVLGRYSLYIYVAHVMVSAAVRTLLKGFLHISNPFIIIGAGVLFGIMVPVIMYKLADRFNMRWIFTLERKRNVKNNRNAIGEGATVTE
ncbi:MAG: acyltransferase [Sphingobacteriales bacterium]|nr:MAG: acyltransferase [Sphingobacteriales bacterium]